MSLVFESVAGVVRNMPDMTEEQLKVLGRNPLKVQEVLRGLLNVRDTFTLTARIDRDMTGWRCVAPVKVEEGEFEFSLQEFLQGDGTYLNGEETVKRAKEQSGLRHIEAIIREQNKIPVEMRKFILVSTEVWLSPGGDRGMWCACWGGDRWVLGYSWLSGGFSSVYRLVGSRKYQK